MIDGDGNSPISLVAMGWEHGETSESISNALCRYMVIKSGQGKSCDVECG